MSYNCLNILKWTEAKLKYTYDVSLREANAQELHEALGEAVMMAISDNWNHAKHTRMPARKAYYISAEYLIGRLVYSNLYNLGILDEMKQLFAQRGVDLAILEEIEVSSRSIFVITGRDFPTREAVSSCVKPYSSMSVLYPRASSTGFKSWR